MDRRTKIELTEPIKGIPAFVSCRLFELIKDKQTKQITKKLIKTVSIVYSANEDILIRRCERHLKVKKKIDIIEIKLLKEWMK